MKDWFVEKLLENTVKKLNENLFKAAYFSERKSLIGAILDTVPEKATIGIGGSVTVREIGIVEILKERGHIVFDHWQDTLSAEAKAEARRSQLNCDVFITGTNAITQNGELVNMDGVGNRVASMIYAPKHVIVVAGYNKIVKDIPSAIERIKSVAAPMNAKRLNLPLPCTELGYCTDCKSERRICRILTIIQRKPAETDISIFLLKEDIGF
ncbi:MAG: lactate utilization protein [Desulfobacterota bacterium]|nr:lactate utilization protein [Thermodesulfobacteriota bacterium]MDW8002171.1 lactate utilization protein [Deltaproteobacteria bacterium]